jgi:Gpi18-like mannosyltransferase
MRAPPTGGEKATPRSIARLTALGSHFPVTLLSALAVVLAVLIVALILVPVHVWRQPAVDAVYSGFDPNLMYVSPSGPAPKAGDVVMSPNELRIVAVPDSHPTVDLVTTPLSFSTSFDVEIAAEPAGSVPLRVELWSPENGAAYVVLFAPSGGDVITAETIVGGTSLQDLVGGIATNTEVLGHYQVGRFYHFTMVVDQSHKKISTRIVGPALGVADSTITPAVAPAVFKAFRYALTLSSSAGTEPSKAIARNFALTLMPQPLATAESTVKVDDATARLLVQLLLAASILICVVTALKLVASRRRQNSIRVLSQVARTARTRAPLAVLLAVALAVYLIANLPLFGLASPHYDVLSAKVWSYVAYHSGLADLYYRTLLVPAAGAWSGVPLHEAGFPYGITKAYYYYAIGWAYHLWPVAAGAVPVDQFSLEALLKSVNVVFGFVDGLFVYLILNRFVSRSTALTSAVLLALNPAVILVMSVWGSTETVSLFFVLGSILLAERNRPLGAWLMLAAAAYTRPQMLVLAFLLGAVYLRKFGARRNLLAIAWTVIVAFLFIGPFALAISPSVPVDYVARTLIFHFGNGQADLPYQGTSPGYYSIWTLPLLLVNGQHGLDRMWSPSTQPLFGSLTYGQVGASLAVGLVLAVGAVLLLRGSASSRPGQYFPVIAFGMLGWLMVTPGLISRYFVYAIVAIILCRKVFTNAGYFWTVGILTAITCISAYGHLSLDFLGYSGSVGVLSPTNNAFSQFVFNLFSADRFISLAALINIAILAVVAAKAWSSLRSDSPPRLQPAATPARSTAQVAFSMPANTALPSARAPQPAVTATPPSPRVVQRIRAHFALWSVLALAVAMLALTLIPAEFWKAPVDDATYSGFDPVLISADGGGGGAVRVGNSSIEMQAESNSKPSVNLATTQLQKLSASLDVTIMANEGALQPFRIGAWSPWTGSGEFVVFGAAPEDAIVVQAVSGGQPGPSLVGGDVIDSTLLGHYQLGRDYRIAMLVNRAGGSITTRVSADDGTNGEATLSSSQLPSLFSNVQLSLGASASGGPGSSRVSLHNYVLTLPHQRAWVSRVSDPTATAMVIALALLGALALAIAAWWHVADIKRLYRSSGRARLSLRFGAAAVAYVVGNALLFPLGGHPFDLGGAKLWAYVAGAYGPAQLYLLPNVVSLTWIWHGVPYIQSAFPYEPVSAYLSTAIGWLNIVFPGNWTLGPGNDSLEYLIKAVNVAFGLADAILIYSILRRLGTTERLSQVAAGLFLFNPAVWFSMSVWGQTHVFSIFLVLAAILLAEKRLPVWAWLALAAACLTRPQMIVFGFLLGIVFLRKFDWRQNAHALAWTVIAVFVLFSPLLLATSPSLPVDVLRQNLQVQEAGGNVAVLTTVSQDGLSVWPLVTYFLQGLSGLQRAFTPSSETLVDGLTYLRLGQILTLAAMLAVGGTLFLKKRTALESGGYLPLVALGMTSFLMLLTGTLATHFLLALPFLLLIHRWTGNGAYFYIAAIWTITTLVPMYGDMGLLISGLDYPLLAPAHNAVTKLFVDLFASDRFITGAVVANIAAVVWLAWLTSRSRTRERIVGEAA